jgi:hypothetical protein
VVDEVTAGLGEVDAPPVPHEERNTQLVLQSCELGRQRGLREVQPSGRTCDGALLGYREEVSELP